MGDNCTSSTMLSCTSSSQSSTGGEICTTDESRNEAPRLPCKVMAQLLREREQHEKTKQILATEQEKAQGLVRELEHSRQYLDALFNISCPKAEAVRTTVLDVEPRVEQLEREMALLRSQLKFLLFENDCIGDYAGQAPVDNVGSHSAIRKLLPNLSSQPRPLDQLEELRTRIHTAKSGPGVIRQDCVAESEEKGDIAASADSGPPKAEEMISPSNRPRQAHDRDLDVHALCALDAAFGNDFVSTLASPTRPGMPLSGQDYLDEVLLEASVAKDSSSNIDSTPGPLSSPQTTKQVTSRTPLDPRSKENAPLSSRLSTAPSASTSPAWGSTPKSSAVDDDPDSNQWSNPSRLASQPTLRLPQSFLAKAMSYTASIASSDTTLSPPPSPARQVLTGNVQIERDNSMSANEITASHSHQSFAGAVGLSLGNVRPSSVLRDNYNVIPIKMTNRLVGIDWKMSERHNPVFSSASEKASLQNREAEIYITNCLFWVHHIRYEPSLAEVNKYRTVHIDHIPERCDVSDVLGEIRFGSIESINLCSIGNLKGLEGRVTEPRKFARIVFLQEKRASDFQRWAHSKPLTMGGSQVRVWLEMEPTYPRHPEVNEALDKFRMRRIISVLGLDDGDRSRLPAFTKRLGKFEPVSVTQRPHEEPQGKEAVYDTKTVIEFRSILHAYRVFKAIDAGAFKMANGILIENDYCKKKPDGY